jgi:predicted glycosyltransferase
VRVWLDLTNSPHVLVLRPVIDDLRARGHEVEVTARDFAQTLGLCERFGIEHTVIGRHRGANVLGKAWGLASRSRELMRWARGRRFDVALGHGSNDVTVAAALLRIPSATMFDYEWATVQHNVNCRLAQAVVVPDVIPPERLYRHGARGKLRPYEGLKEEYYLADFEPDPAVLGELGLDPSRPIAVLRTAPAVGTPVYTTFEGRPGAVDERLIAEGRLRRLERPEEVKLVKRGEQRAAADRVRRDPAVLTDLLLSAVIDR